MSSPPRGQSPSWASGANSGRQQQQQREEHKQSPAKAVAGAIKKLFRMSSDRSGNDDPPSPVPAVQSPMHTSPTARMQHPKPASFKHQGSMEPPSVLDYEDRFSMATDRTSGLTQSERPSTLTDRTSVITSSDRASTLTDRMSSLTAVDRGSTLTDRSTVDRQSSVTADRASNVSGRSSRGSGGSRIGSYIRNLIKQSTSPTAAQPATGAARSASPTLGGLSSAYSPQAQSPQLYQQSDVSPAGPSSASHGAAAGSSAPWQGGAFVLGGSGPSSPTGPYRSPRTGSPTLPLQSSPPRSEYVQMPQLSPAAISRMQRDPNLLTVCNDLPANMDRPSWRLEDFTLLQKLHAGYASAVYKAFCRTSGQTVALKLYQPAKLHEISQFQLYREARLHTLMSHPNIIKLYAAFRNGETVVLVQEYADGGDLLQLLMQHSTRLSERRACNLVLQPLLRALYYLHSRMIVHRDVKLENILFMGREMTLKLADFGLCLNLREERSVTRAGTLDYMAPEVLRCPQKHKPQDNKERLDLAYNMAVDIWALGVVAYELLNGCPPFTCHDKKETEKRIQSGLMPEFVVEVSDAARDFVYSCLTGNADQRPTAYSLLKSPWIKAGTRNSTSVLMETMAARRAAANASSPAAALAPLADVHMEDSQDEEEQSRSPHQAPPHTTPPMSPTAPTYPPAVVLATQHSEPLAPSSKFAGSPRLQAPGVRGPLDPANSVTVPSSVNTGRLNVGNLVASGSGPLMASVKSGQPLLPTTQLLQQHQPAAAFNTPQLSTTLSASLGRAGSIGTTVVASPQKAGGAWSSNPSSEPAYDAHAYGPPAGLSPVQTRSSQQKPRPGAPDSPASHSSPIHPHAQP